MSRTVRYRLLNKIAHGGMAEIFLAWQTGAEGFQKQVVLKRILPALAADPAFVRMLVDEAHIASTLNHGNLVQVLDLGKSGDEFFLVLEFVDGWSLEHVRKRAQKARMKLPLPLILYVTSALCRALAYVHTRKRGGKALGIVHRDVTPQNVLLSREGEVKLADFGIAKAAGRTEKSATGIIKGKFAYMSPEQSIGGELDARSDLFAVGTMMYVLTTGKKPFDGATDLDVLMQVRKAKYEKPSTMVKEFNPEVERFIARALRSDRARRWQTAGQMADRLDAILLKLGQPSGPAVLKRWLESLSAKDGVLPPAELAEATGTTGTVQLGTRDLELEGMSEAAKKDEAEDEGIDESSVYYADDGGAGTDGDSEDESPAPARGAAGPEAPLGAPGADHTPNPRDRRSASRSTAAATTADATAAAALTTMTATKRDPGEASRARTRAAQLASEIIPPEELHRRPGRLVRLARAVRLTALRTLVTLFLLGGAAYFAHPYLPARLVNPVAAWLRDIPARLRAAYARSDQSPPGPAQPSNRR
jgi:serine/threonine protein kinase